MDWWRSYFDELYAELYMPRDLDPERLEREVHLLEEALRLKESDRILDLACGYGRHAIELSKRGYRVTGLDYSEYLLSLAWERARKERVDVTFIKGDMRELPFSTAFDKVFLFYTSFGYFSDEDNLKTLKEISRVMKKGGLVLIDVWNLLSAVHNIWRRSWFREGNLIVLEEVDFDPISQRFTNKRTIFKEGKMIDERTFTVRGYTAGELSFMMKLAGLTPVRFYGSMDMEPFTKDSRRLIVVARKQ